MTDEVWLPITVCLTAFFATFLLCRRGGSLGLPVAFVVNLLLIHVPGAYAYGVAGQIYRSLFLGTATLTGFRLSALATGCFVAGVWLARRSRTAADPAPSRIDPIFVRFCLIGGWLFAFGLTPLRAIPSLGAALVFGSSIWMVGVMLGMTEALEQRRLLRQLLWIVALLVYPATVLIFGGFLSYGTTAVMIVLSYLVVRARRAWLALAIAPLLCYLGISLFVNYFEQRTFLRSVLWSEAGFEQRVDALGQAFSGFKLFDPYDRGHVRALALRLNQNMFVGVAATRLERGDIEYYHGRSVYEGAIALIPRALWQDKPVYGGSPAVVSEVTGWHLNKKTSWGVGNVLEFYLSYGYWSLVAGFVLLGWAIGRLDVLGYRRLASGRLGDALIFILPGIALIQPNGSLVEIMGGAAAALVAAFGWRYAWSLLDARRVPLRPSAPPAHLPRRHASPGG